MQIQTSKIQQPRVKRSIADGFRAKLGPEPKLSKLDSYLADIFYTAHYVTPSSAAVIGEGVVGGASFLAGLGGWGIAAGTLAAAAGVGLAGHALERHALSAHRTHTDWNNSMNFAHNIVESTGLKDGELKEFKDADVVTKDDKMLVRFNDSGDYLLITSPGEKRNIAYEPEFVVRWTPSAGEGLTRMNAGIKPTGYKEYRSTGLQPSFSYAAEKGTKITLSDSGKLSASDAGGWTRFPNGAYEYDLNAVKA